RRAESSSTGLCADARATTLVLDDGVAAGAALLSFREETLGVHDDRAGDVDPAGAFDSFEPRRAVDLEDLRPGLRFEHVDAGDLETHDARRGDRRARVALVEVHADAEAAAVEVRSELAALRLPSHRGDDASADDDRARVASLRLGDVLLEDDVLTH